MTCSRDGIGHRESCLKCAKRDSVAWHTGASPADDIGSPIPHNGQKAYEISQPTDSSPIWLLPGSLARWLRYTFPRTRNEDELRLRAILILAIIAISASAQTPELRVSLRELTGEAIKNSPDIAAAQKRYEAARQRPTQESTLPDPMISLGYNSAGNPLPGAGIGRDELANLGLMVSQEIPAPGKLKLKGDMASKEAQAEFQQYQAVQLVVISRLKQAYYRLQNTYAATDLLIRNRDLLEQERKSRAAEINSILNRGAGTPIGRPEDVKPKELTATLEELFAAARQNSPMLGRDRKMVERSELAVNMARKEYYPDVTLNAGYYFMGGMPPMYEVRADVKVPVYFWRKQRAGVNEQVSSLSQVRRTYEATDQSLTPARCL